MSAPSRPPAGPASASVEQALARLVDRFDPAVLDGSEQGSRIRLVVGGQAHWDALFHAGALELTPAASGTRCDARLIADRDTWLRIVEDVRGGLDAYRAGRLIVRHNLNLGVAFLVATSGVREEGRPHFRRIATPSGVLSLVQAGVGHPVLLLHGLGATKISFLPTVAALADRFRMISVDQPGFGDSEKPIRGRYDAAFFARAALDVLDALQLERAHVVGNSMGGRVALELALRHPGRVRSLVLLCPSLAWKRRRSWAPFVRLLRPELGLVQLSPRRVVEEVVRRIVPGASAGWVQAGVDEFLRSYQTPRGRFAFYAAARQIYLEEPHGAEGFWTRLAGLAASALFIWGERDQLVPMAFSTHVRAVLPGAEQLVLDCGHVPQLERPTATHEAMARFMSEASARLPS